MVNLRTNNTIYKIRKAIYNASTLMGLYIQNVILRIYLSLVALSLR